MHFSHLLSDMDAIQITPLNISESRVSWRREGHTCLMDANAVIFVYRKTVCHFESTVNDDACFSYNFFKVAAYFSYNFFKVAVVKRWYVGRKSYEICVKSCGML